MDDYAKEKRTENNLIVRSGISEAETTNNKRLRSTFCIEAIRTRSIARPLCDSRASCFTEIWRYIDFQNGGRPPSSNFFRRRDVVDTRRPLGLYAIGVHTSRTKWHGKFEFGTLSLFVATQCVQLNYFLFSSLRRIRPCCRQSQTNIRWCVADFAIYTAKR